MNPTDYHFLIYYLVVTTTGIHMTAWYHYIAVRYPELNQSDPIKTLDEAAAPFTHKLALYDYFPPQVGNYFMCMILGWAFVPFLFFGVYLKDRIRVKRYLKAKAKAKAPQPPCELVQAVLHSMQNNFASWEEFNHDLFELKDGDQVIMRVNCNERDYWGPSLHYEADADGFRRVPIEPFEAKMIFALWQNMKEVEQKGWETAMRQHVPHFLKETPKLQTP
jgi:hypothetical protein